MTGFFSPVPRSDHDFAFSFRSRFRLSRLRVRPPFSIPCRTRRESNRRRSLPTDLRSLTSSHGELSLIPASGGPSRTIEIEGKLPAPRCLVVCRIQSSWYFLRDLPDDVPAAQVWTAPADGSASTEASRTEGLCDPLRAFRRTARSWPCCLSRVCRELQARCNR